jgi:hypothetical protein
MRSKYVITLFLLCLLKVQLWGQMPNLSIPPFSVEIASKFSNQAYSCLTSEYPNRIVHSLEASADVKSPMALHPAFYGCYDWHSSVHGHWMLVKMLQLFPDLPNRNEIIKTLDKNLTKENIQAEINYLKAKDRNSFERPYGWAWCLKLTAELANADTDYGKRWFKNMLPLAETIKSMYYDYLPGLYYPIRRGVYENTAFGLAFAFDYAQQMDDKTFAAFIKERSTFYFGNDRNIPASWEPEGDDFFSPSLIEAELMRRVLNRDEFLLWFKNFMPQLPFSLTSPAVVADRDDPKGVHLDGLNLSRAWCLFELAKALPDDSQMHRDLWQSGYRHASEALPNVLSDNYVGSHWLSTFAVYMYLSLADIEQ